MKKLIPVFIVLSLVFALLIVPTSAKGKIVNVTITGENVAPRASDKLEMLYDGTILSEADATAMNFTKKGIVLIQNKTRTSEVPSECTIVFELDTLQDIDTVYINWYVYGNAMIGLPYENSLIVGTSADGNAFNEIAWTMEGEADLDSSSQIETVIDLGSTVKAKYVSISFAMGPNGMGWADAVSWEWVGLTELGAGLKADEILGGGYGEVSQEPVIDLDDIEPIVEVPAGAKFIKHVPFNTSITGGSSTIITDPTTVQTYNVAWSTTALLRPTETAGEYEVVSTMWVNGDYDFTYTAEDFEEGDIVLAVHGDDTAVAGSVANRDALTALVAGDIVTFAGYDFKAGTFETGAVVYYAVPAETPDVSETPDESTPADESVTDESTPADESEKADESVADTSVADTSKDNSEKGGKLGLILGIAGGVVAAAVIVVVVVIVVKKKK